LGLGLSLPSQAVEEGLLTYQDQASSLDPHYANHKADLRLKLAVKWELALRPYVDADFIHVTVRDGVVTLRGSVEDQVAAKVAALNALEAGAKKVINKLTTEEGK
jgi:osmotically-inducible protein OsmY